MFKLRRLSPRPGRTARQKPAGSRRAPRPALTLALLALAAAALSLAFMFYGVKGDWSFILPLRAGRLAALILVAYAIAVSTVLFQTITHNRILTPSLMGFDQLYMLIQTLILFAAGPLSFSLIAGSAAGFVLSAALLALFALALFHGLFLRRGKDLHLVLLAGIIMGVLFRSLSGFLSRLIAPDEFAVLQDKSFASFNSYNNDLLLPAALIIAAASAIGWHMRRSFDALALGRDIAVNLGLDYRRLSARILLLVAIMVAAATALVGPVSFFGLLVASLAYQLAGAARHAVILPMAALIAIITLVGGQFIFERLFQFNTALAIIINFCGGIIFIALLLKGKIR